MWEIDFNRDQFTESLGRCHNIIRDNDKLSPEAAFDEISKILFIKIRSERMDKTILTENMYNSRLENYNSVLENTSIPYYQYLYDLVKDFYKSDQIFDPNDKFRIRENSFRKIIKELEIFNLSEVSDDIKGLAFEKFLGTTFRGELGQFFTPRSIVNFMVGVLNPQEGECVLDPCCGSGGFIIRAYEYVRELIEKSEIPNSKEDRIKFLATSNIFGVDANPRMARTAKMNMIMHGDGHSGIHHHDGLIDCDNIFEGRFDVILTNPPFGAKVSKNAIISKEDIFVDSTKDQLYQKEFGLSYTKSRESLNKSVGKKLIEQFFLGKSYSQTEVLFLERCLNLLKPGGRMGIVLPEGVMNNTPMEKARQFVEDRARILLIVSLPKSVFVKSGANVKTSILFLRKFTEKELTEYRTLQRIYKGNRSALKLGFDYEIPIMEIEEPISGELGDQDFKKPLDLFVNYRDSHNMW